MHKFYNFGFAANNAVKTINLDNSEKFFSYLPLCHIAERLLVEMGSLYTGGQVSFAESLDTFAQNLSETQPTVFLGVPEYGLNSNKEFSEVVSEKTEFLYIPIISSLIKRKSELDWV